MTTFRLRFTVVLLRVWKGCSCEAGKLVTGMSDVKSTRILDLDHSSVLWGVRPKSQLSNYDAEFGVLQVVSLSRVLLDQGSAGF